MNETFIPNLIVIPDGVSLVKVTAQQACPASINFQFCVCRGNMAVNFVKYLQSDTSRDTKYDSFFDNCGRSDSWSTAVKTYLGGEMPLLGIQQSRGSSGNFYGMSATASGIFEVSSGEVWIPISLISDFTNRDYFTYTSTYSFSGISRFTMEVLK